MLTDYHVHLRQDELSATAVDHFTPDNITNYVDAATRAGVSDLGCAEHMYRFTEALSVWSHPFWEEWALDDLDMYCETVASSPIKLGIEADYVLGAEDRLEEMLSKRPFDYVIGSVHFIGGKSIDTEDFTVWDDTGDADEIWSRYFETLARAATSGLFDILAHPDLVKVWGRARQQPSRDLRFFYEPAIEAIVEAGVTVEVSTAGLRKAVGEIYPSPGFMDMCVDAGASFALSSDAHEPGQIGFEYDKALEFLSDHGVSEIATFKGRKRTMTSLAPHGAGHATDRA
ncbi:MAG: histidinol-phosphatase HisJ family protein [Solirubrobacterales bacterium]